VVAASDFRTRDRPSNPYTKHRLPSPYLRAAVALELRQTSATAIRGRGKSDPEFLIENTELGFDLNI